MKKNGLLPGFTYHCEILDADKNILDAFKVDNLIPIQGMQRVASLLLGTGATTTSDWYMGLLDTGLTIAAANTLQDVATYYELDGYSVDDERATANLIYDDEYVIDNTASLSEFTFAAGTTVYGAFICDILGVNEYATGALLSLANFDESKIIPAGGTLRVTASITLSS